MMLFPVLLSSTDNFIVYLSHRCLACFKHPQNSTRGAGKYMFLIRNTLPLQCFSNSDTFAEIYFCSQVSFQWSDIQITEAVITFDSKCHPAKSVFIFFYTYTAISISEINAELQRKVVLRIKMKHTFCIGFQDLCGSFHLSYVFLNMFLLYLQLCNFAKYQAGEESRSKGENLDSKQAYATMAK